MKQSSLFWAVKTQEKNELAGKVLLLVKLWKIRCYDARGVISDQNPGGQAGGKNCCVHWLSCLQPACGQGWGQVQGWTDPWNRQLASPKWSQWFFFLTSWETQSHKSPSLVENTNLCVHSESLACAAYILNKSLGLGYPWTVCFGFSRNSWVQWHLLTSNEVVFKLLSLF